MRDPYQYIIKKNGEDTYIVFDDDGWATTHSLLAATKFPSRDFAEKAKREIKPWGEENYHKLFEVRQVQFNWFLTEDE